MKDYLIAAQVCVHTPRWGFLRDQNVYVVSSRALHLALADGKNIKYQQASKLTKEALSPAKPQTVSFKINDFDFATCRGYFLTVADMVALGFTLQELQPSGVKHQKMGFPLCACSAHTIARNAVMMPTSFKVKQ